MWLYQHGLGGCLWALWQHKAPVTPPVIVLQYN